MESTEKDDLKAQLETLKAEHKKQTTELTDAQKAKEAQLEAKINPPKPVVPLTFGDITFKGHSYQDGTPINGTLSIMEPGATKEGVFRAAKASNGNLSSEGFSFSVDTPTPAPKPAPLPPPPPKAPSVKS